MIERVLIADDEPLARERARQLVARLSPRAECREVGDGDAALEAIQAFAPQLVLLDIEMPGFRGLELIERIGADRMPPTIFVTAYDQHAIAAFDLAALDYLLKPVDEARFAVAWSRAEQRQQLAHDKLESERFKLLLETLVSRSASSPPASSSRLVLKAGSSSIVVPLDCVEWIESNGNHVLFHGEKESYRARETLAGIEARLEPSSFVRIHRRFLIRIESIRELQPWSGGDQLLILRSGAKLPVSRNYRDGLARRLGLST